jgi:hypothetical protein
VSPFTGPARVYREDTDRGAIVCYANYLRCLQSIHRAGGGFAAAAACRRARGVPGGARLRPKRRPDSLISALRAEAEI